MGLSEDLAMLAEGRPLEVEHDEGVYTIQWPTGHWITCFPSGSVFIGKLSSDGSPERIVCRKHNITAITSGPHTPQATKDEGEHWFDRLIRQAEAESDSN